MRTPPNFVRASGVAMATLSLAACTSMETERARPVPAPTERAGPPSSKSNDLLIPDNVKIGVRSKFGTAELKDGIYQCADPSHPKRTLYPDCKGIPVIVLQKTTGGCLSLIPYAGLIIHSERKKTKVVWQIYGPTGYEFAAANGIELRRLSGGTLNPGDVYTQSQHQGDRFKWELKEGAYFPGGMAHDAHVVDPSGVPCEPLDPVAINVID